MTHTDLIILDAYLFPSLNMTHRDCQHARESLYSTADSHAAVDLYGRGRACGPSGRQMGTVSRLLGTPRPRGGIVQPGKGDMPFAQPPTTASVFVATHNRTHDDNAPEAGILRGGSCANSTITSQG
jgi:hypothetical protein